MSRVYLDSMIWIYSSEADARYGSQANAFLSTLRSRGYTLLASHFLLAELLVYPERDGNVFLATSYRRALRAKDVETIPFTERTARAFAKIRAQHKVSAPDAIHLALAATGGAELFVTQDTAAEVGYSRRWPDCGPQLRIIERSPS